MVIVGPMATVGGGPRRRYHPVRLFDTCTSGTTRLRVIRSPQNTTIKRLVSMRNHRRRRAAGIALVDGPREAWRAIQAGWKLLGFYEPIDSSSDPPNRVGSNSLIESQRVRDHAIDQDVHFGVEAGVFEKIAYGDVDHGGLAEFETPSRSLSDLPNDLSGLVVVLDRVEKPGNIGAVFRTADAVGAAAILLSDCPGDVMNPNAIRGSVGAVFTVPYANGSMGEVSDWLRRKPYRMLAMRVEANRSAFEHDLTGDVAVILGSEADGLGDRWRHFGATDVDGMVIPMVGDVDSLNLSVSAAVIAFESLRQRSILPE